MRRIARRVVAPDCSLRALVYILPSFRADGRRLEPKSTAPERSYRWRGLQVRATILPYILLLAFTKGYGEIVKRPVVIDRNRIFRLLSRGLMLESTPVCGVA